MESRILAIWATWNNKESYVLWDIYPASRKALNNAGKEVHSLEERGARVIVSYDELSEEVGRRHLDIIYETGKDLSWVWKDLWEEK